MQQYLTRRFLLAVVTLIGVSWLIFFMMWIIPGDVAIAILGDGANADTVAALRQPMGRNDPWYVQYRRWMGKRVSGSIETKTYGKSTMANMAKADSVG
jgi:peptide/nickel transport system permease protein